MVTDFGPNASDISFPAAEDLSSYQYHFVKINTSGAVRLLDSADELPDGVLQNAPASGEEATVRIFGHTKVVANAALDEGALVRAEYVSATDCGKAATVLATTGVVLGKVVEASAAENDLVGLILIPAIGQTYNQAVVSDTTADANTYTASELLSGFIRRDPNGGARSDVTPTGTALATAMLALGLSSFEFTIENFGLATEVVTITAGVGVTLTGTMTIAGAAGRRFRAVATSATAVTIYSLGTYTA